VPAPEISSVDLAVIHHTATSNSYDPGETPHIIRAIFSQHRTENGFDDIGYNLLVDRYGQVFEGRAGGIDRAVVGAHARGWNSRTTGIAVIGTFVDEALPPAAFDALVATVAWKLALHGAREVVAHGDLDPTTVCPGSAIRAQLAELRGQVAQRI
jgi:hypothetical protein